MFMPQAKEGFVVLYIYIYPFVDWVCISHLVAAFLPGCVRVTNMYHQTNGSSLSPNLRTGDYTLKVCF